MILNPGTGVLVHARDSKWKGISQAIDASSFTGTAYTGKVFLQAAETTTEDVVMEMIAAKILAADGSTTYENLGSITIPTGSTEWYPLMFTVENSNFGQYSSLKESVQNF